MTAIYKQANQRGKRPPIKKPIIGSTPIVQSSPDQKLTTASTGQVIVTPVVKPKTFNRGQANKIYFSSFGNNDTNTSIKKVKEQIPNTYNDVIEPVLIPAAYVSQKAKEAIKYSKNPSAQAVTAQIQRFGNYKKIYQQVTKKSPNVNTLHSLFTNGKVSQAFINTHAEQLPKLIAGLLLKFEFQKANDIANIYKSTGGTNILGTIAGNKGLLYGIPIGLTALLGIPLGMALFGGFSGGRRRSRRSRRRSGGQVAQYKNNGYYNIG